MTTPTTRVSAVRIERTLDEGGDHPWPTSTSAALTVALLAVALKRFDLIPSTYEHLFRKNRLSGLTLMHWTCFVAAGAVAFAP
jgi:hypothetical protein